MDCLNSFHLSYLMYYKLRFSKRQYIILISKKKLNCKLLNVIDTEEPEVEEK